MSIKVYNEELKQWEIIVPTRGDRGDTGPTGPPGPLKITDSVSLNDSTTAASAKAIKTLMDELNALKSLL